MIYIGPISFFTISFRNDKDKLFRFPRDGDDFRTVLSVLQKYSK